MTDLATLLCLTSLCGQLEESFQRVPAHTDDGMNDATAAVFWIMATSIVGGSAFLMARNWFPHERFAATTLHVITLSWACIVCVAMLLGISGRLTSPLLILSAVACASGGAWYTYGNQVGRNKSAQFRHQPIPTRPLELRKASFGPTPFSTTAFFTLVWGIVVSILIARVTFQGLLRLPDDWDTLAYHLPLLTHWLKEGTLYAPGCAFGYVPGNNELLGLWAVAPFSGDFFMCLNNILPAILLAVVSFELCQLLGVIQPIAHFCSLGIISTRPMFLQLVSAENDLAVAALFLTTLVYAIRFAKQQRPPDVWLAAMTFGLLIGIKYYALGYAAVAGVALIGLVAANCGRRVATKAFEIGLVGAVLLGGYWYFRNAWHYGSPLFPKGLADGADVWNEMRPQSHTSTLLHGGRNEAWRLLAHAVFAQAGPITLLSVFMLPASVVWSVVSAFRKRPTREANMIRFTLACVMLLATVVYGLTPNVIETKLGTMNMLISQYHPVRFGVSFFSISMVGLALATSDLVRWLSAIRVPFYWFGSLAGGVVSGLWLVGIAWQLIRHMWQDVTLDEWLLASNLGLAGTLAYFGWTSRSVIQRAGILALVVSTMLLATWGTATLSGRWHQNFISHYEQRMTGGSLQFLATLDPSTERICVCDSRYYPFFGSRRQFDVCRPLWFRDVAALLRYVADQQVTILLLTTSGPDASGRYTPIKAWVLEHPQIFRVIDENRRYTMFRVDRKALLDRPTITEGRSGV